MRRPGKEVPDPTPLEIPIGYGAPPTMRELVQEYVEGALSQQAAEDDFGTFEEEDDFEEDDEALLDLSGYEVTEFEMVDEDPQPDPAPPEGAPVDGSEDPPTEPPIVEPAAQ